jgi:hypothetical protein
VLQGVDVGSFLTPRNGVLLEKLIVSHSPKKFAVSYGTRCSVNVVTTRIIERYPEYSPFLKNSFNIFSSLPPALQNTFIS